MTAARQPIQWNRVIAEGVVIVGSILLAFGIDAAWDGMQERREEARLLTSLAEDLRVSRSEAESVIFHYEETDRLLSRLQSLPEAALRADAPDSITAMVNALASPRTFDPTLGTLEALISAGKMNVLSDPELREALTSVRTLVDDAKEEEGYVTHFAIRVWEAEVAHGGPWRVDGRQVRPGGQPLADLPFVPSASAEDALSLRRDRQLMGMSRLTQLNGAMYAGEIRQILAKLDSILTLIEDGP